MQTFSSIFKVWTRSSNSCWAAKILHVWPEQSGCPKREAGPFSIDSTLNILQHLSETISNLWKQGVIVIFQSTVSWYILHRQATALVWPQWRRVLWHEGSALWTMDGWEPEIESQRQPSHLKAIALPNTFKQSEILESVSGPFLGIEKLTKIQLIPHDPLII